MAKGILVFDDQHNLWTNVFARVYVYSSQDVKLFWTKALREKHLKKAIRRLIEDLQGHARIQDIRWKKPKHSI